MELTPVREEAVRQLNGSHEKIFQPKLVPIARWEWSWLKEEARSAIMSAI